MLIFSLDETQKKLSLTGHFCTQIPNQPRAGEGCIFALLIFRLNFSFGLIFCILIRKKGMGEFSSLLLPVCLEQDLLSSLPVLAILMLHLGFQHTLVIIS